jgi:hypothetical protein
LTYTEYLPPSILSSIFKDSDCNDCALNA